MGSETYPPGEDAVMQALNDWGFGRQARRRQGLRKAMGSRQETLTKKGIAASAAAASGR